MFMVPDISHINCLNFKMMSDDKLSHFKNDLPIWCNIGIKYRLNGKEIINYIQEDFCHIQI